MDGNGKDIRRKPRAISRRQFCQTAAVGLGGFALGGCLNGRLLQPGEPEVLPAPIFAGKSVELCLNSRASKHFGLHGTATTEQVSSILWAAGRAPVTGSHRTIYLKTVAGTRVYDPQDHALEAYSTERVLNALRIDYDRERDFDAGVSYMCALLASVSLWAGTNGQLGGCPQVGDLNFGVGDVAALTDELAATSSDGSLPDPSTDGADKLEDVLTGLRLDAELRPDLDLTPPQLSQLLWAAYGCTPHDTITGRAGLTVPSWVAQYFLTNRIYVVDARVARYCNRQGSDMASRDHRLELVQDADVRPTVRQALPDLPAAPCYVLLCLTQTGLDTWYQRLETGFAAGAMLLQAGASGLGCAFKAALAPSEQTALKAATQIPAGDYPHAVVALGQRPTNAAG
jgi:hypothetical protein